MARTGRAVSSKAEPTHPSTEVIVVNGVPVTTRSTGSGDPVILLNRFRGTLDTWDPAFVAALASRYRVVMFDSLGIGETGGHTPATVEATADFAGRVIEAMEFHSPAVLGPSEASLRRSLRSKGRGCLASWFLRAPCRREARQKRSGASDGWRQRATLCRRATWHSR